MQPTIKATIDKVPEIPKYICLRCGLSIGWWQGAFWKHHAGWKTKKSCGLPPIVGIVRQQ